MPPRPLPSPLLHPAAARRPGAGWRDIATWLLFALAALRGVLLLAHDPLLALANNYDQVRYTACLGLYPYRPGVPPQQQNYQAPLRTYAFQAQADAVCYWTSDLLFQGAAAAGYRLAEGLGGGPLHSVRSLAALRLAAWLLAALLLQRAWRRDGRSDLALAHAACVAVLAMDPVNTLLLGGWYAEAGALFFAWFAVGLAVLAAQRATPLRLLLLALVAFGLGTSKLQHLLLPLCLGGALLLPALWRTPRLWAPLLALLLGGLPALALQAWQMQRDNGMTATIRLANNTDFVLSALLPASADPARTAQRLGLDARCAAASGASIYTVTEPAEQACPGIGGLSRVRALGLLGREPATLGRMLARAPARLLPWIPDYLGVVEGGEVAPLPADVPSLDRLLGRRAGLAWGLLLAPLAGFLWLLLRGHAAAPSLAFAGLAATLAVTVPVVSVFGDGYAELAKHAHLALNAGAAWLLGAGVAALAGRRHRHVT